MLNIGHRGAALYAPENTLKSIRKAIDLKVDYVELDVQSSIDGHLIIMHDKRVDRTTNGTGFVNAKMLAELRKLDAGDGEHVPTLNEAFNVAGDYVDLILEIITPGIAEKVATAVLKRGLENTTIFASFLHSELLAVRRLIANASTLALIEGIPVSMTSFASEARATHVGLGLDSITKPFVEALHSKNLKVFVYTVNNEANMQLALSLNVDGIISDCPDKVTEIKAYAKIAI